MQKRTLLPTYRIICQTKFFYVKADELFSANIFYTLLTYFPSFFSGAECRREVVSTDDGISDDDDSDAGRGAAICVCKEGHTGDPDSEEGCKRDLVK